MARMNAIIRVFTDSIALRLIRTKQAVCLVCAVCAFRSPRSSGWSPRSGPTIRFWQTIPTLKFRTFARQWHTPLKPYGSANFRCGGVTLRFLNDNSLSPRLAAELAQLGHDAKHVRELGLAAATDRTLFDLAATEGRVVVAQDTDFAAILAQTQTRLPSVLLFRTRAKSTEFLLRTLNAQLPAIAGPLDIGAIVVIEDARIRIRALPLD